MPVHHAHGHAHGHADAGGNQLIRGAWFYDLRAAALGDRGRRLLRTLATDLRLGPGDRVLDVGCGPGRLAAVLAELTGPSGSVAGVDASPEMVARARAKRGSDRVQFRVAQAQNLPYADAEFDGLACTLVLHHVAAADRPAAVAEFFRVLKPGGRLVIAEFDAHQRPLWHKLPFTRGHSHHHDHDSLAEARALAEAAGFVELTTGPTPVRWAAELTGRKP